MRIEKPKPEFDRLDFRKDIKREEKEDNGLIREVLLIRESDAPIVRHYLKSLSPKDSNYVTHTKTSFSIIKKLEPNLLREPYWVIGNHGSMGGLKPPRMDNFNTDVVENYLNHIIISSNFSMMPFIIENEFKLPMVYGDLTVKYDVKFITTLPNEVLEDYIQSKLGPLYDYIDYNRISKFILSNKQRKKKIIEIVDTFEKQHKFPVDVIFNSISDNDTKVVNGLIKSLLLKDKEVALESLGLLLTKYNESYVQKVLENNLEIAYKLVFRKNIQEKDKFKTNYMNYYINEVDPMNLVIIQGIISKKEDFRVKMHKIIMYLSRDTNYTITNYRGGL